MAKFPELASVVSDALALPLATVQIRGRDLRECGLMTNEGRGAFAASMTTADASALMMSLATPHVRTGDVGAELKAAQARLLVRTKTEPETDGVSTMKFVHPLGLSFPDGTMAGTALTALIDDFRTGAFKAWGGRKRAAVTIDFAHLSAAMHIYLHREETTAELSYGSLELRDAKKAEKYPVERIVRIRTPVLEQIAGVLGPP